jgi:hypothetical protein
MNTKSNRQTARAARKSAAAPQIAETPAVETPAIVAETPALVQTDGGSIVDPATLAADEVATSTPVTTDVPAPAVAPKVTWEDTMKKAQASFAKTGSFREGTNRALLYPLLTRPEGVSLVEASDATLARGGKVRVTSSIHTDLHDIAKITQRKLVRCDKGDQKRYRLADVAPVAPVAATEEVK